MAKSSLKAGEAKRLGIALWLAVTFVGVPFFMHTLTDIRASREHLRSAETQCPEGRTCTSQTELRTARAAEDMVDLAVWQMLFGLLGIYLVAQTLRATREAVVEANEATDAARQALSVTREGMQRQLRAYVHATNADPGALVLGEKFSISVTIKNLGATPATKMRSRYGIAIVQNPHAHIVEYPPELPIAESTLGPGLEYIIHIPTRGPLTANELSLLQTKNAYVMMFADITYEDVFGEARETTIRFVVDKMTEDRLHVRPTLVGNTST